MSRDYDAKRLARVLGIPYAEALRRVRADREKENSEGSAHGGQPVSKTGPRGNS